MSSFLQAVRHARVRWSSIAITLATAVVVSYPARANDVNQLASRLAQLRGEVEQLAQSLSAKNTETKDALQSLSRQRSDLQLELQREETRVQKLSAAVAKHRTEMAAEQAKGERLIPLYKEAFAKTEEYIKSSLPFRRTERLSELNKLDEQYRAGLLSPPRALSRLWGFIEDEFRITRENGLFQQTVTVNGEEHLAEVVRLGMVMLFYKTNDGQVGKAIAQNDNWTYEAVDSPEGQRAILELFTSFKKQIRVGYFRLPNALPPAVTK